MDSLDRHCEYCHRDAKFLLGADKLGFAVCGIHYRYVLRRVPEPDKLTRMQIRSALGFIYPHALPLDVVREYVASREVRRREL